MKKIQFIKDKDNHKKGEILELNEYSFDFLYWSNSKCIKVIEEKKKGKKKNESVLEND